MKDRWSQLSMSEKSDLMSLYIKNGISSLEEIKKHYNSFATGGSMSPDEPPESEDNKIYQSIWNISKEENPNGQKERLEIMAANNYVKPYTAVLRTYPYFHKNYVISHSALRAYRDGFDHQMNPVSVSKYFDDSNYNLFNNNCSDATGEALNLDTKGLTTPKYIREQVLKKHPDAKEHTRKDNVVLTKFPISKAEYDRIKAEQIKQTRINNGEVSENYSIEDALHDNTFATGGHLYYEGGPEDDKYSFLRREPEVAVADNTRVQLYPSNLFEQQVQQAIVAEEERKAQAEFERKQARRTKNEAEARAREAERRAKTPAILREPTVGEISARLHPELVVTKPINTGTIYDKSKAELEEQAANWGRSVGSVATMTPEMISRNPITAVALGGLGEMTFLSGRYPFTNFGQTLSTAGELLSPSTYTELLGASPVVGNIANTALGADIAYHSIQDLPEATESFRLNNDLGSGLRTGLDLLGVSPLYSMGKAGVGLVGNAANSIQNTNFARSVALTRNLNKSIRNATRYGDIRVPESYFHNPESVYRVTSPWERATLQITGQSTRASNSPIISLVNTHDPYYARYRKFANNPENWVVDENGEIKLDRLKMFSENIGLHKDAGHDHGVFGLNKGKTFYNSANLNTGDVILETSGTDKQFRVGHHKNYSQPVEFSENMAEANPRYSGRKQPPLALKDFDTQIPSQDFSYFERMPDGTFKYEGRIFPEKREYILGRDYTITPTLDQAVQEAKNARIEVPEVLSAREPFEMPNIPNWREIFFNYNPNTARTVRTTTQSTEFNPSIFGFNKGNTDTRFEFFEPWKFINYDLSKMSTDEVVKTFGPRAKHLKELYDVAAANNFEGKYATIAKDVESKLSKMFAINPEDADVAAGLAKAKGIYDIPEYTERFKKYGDLGETFIQDAKSRLDNIQLQGVSRDSKITGQHGVEGSASTTPHPIQPTITLSNDNRSSVIREVVTHEANHAAHGTKYQPKWMEIHNEKIRPVPKKDRKDFTNFDKYLDEMDELVERSKTAVEYAHETRLEGETLDQALDRVFEAADKDVYNSEIPSDIRQMVKNYTKDSVLKFWKEFLGGLSVPIGVGIGASQSQSN